LFDQGPAASRLLVVDDEADVRGAVAEALRRAGHRVEEAEGGEAALARLRAGGVDGVLLDIVMPGTSGLVVLETIVAWHPDVPVLILTGAGTLDHAVRALRLGAYDFLAKPIVEPELLLHAVARALERRRLLLAARGQRESLEREVRDKTRELAIRNRQLSGYVAQLEDLTVGVVASLLVAMEAKDPDTAGHSTRVTAYALALGRRLGLPTEELLVLERAAMLHDIGKLSVEASAIRKPGPLSDGEWAHILRHPEVGERMLAPFPFLARERAHIRHHHERFDGKGYPDGIRGAQIPVLTEILSVADSFDAMTSPRNYRRRTGRSEARAELERSVGSQFSERVVPALAELLAGGRFPLVDARPSDTPPRTDGLAEASPA
jgi:response regulator RpfG family c-di-GMP phosphodiesterase